MAPKYPMIITTVLVTAVLGIIGLNLAPPAKRIRHHVEHRYDVANPQFPVAMGACLGPPLVGGNHVETFLNGDQIFEAMLKAIRSASKSITFETYIYWSGDIGAAFAARIAGFWSSTAGLASAAA